MSRLTYSQGYAVNLKGMPTDVTCEEYCANIPCGNGCDGCLIDKAIRKLAHYEDLEEQGRLIELPCAVGDTVYWISESDSCLFCNGPCYERCEEGALKIKEIPFKPHMLNEIGEIIFLTKEAAEAKLKEMEGVE